MRSRVQAYLDTLVGLIQTTEVTTRDGHALALEAGLERLRNAAHEAHDRGGRVMFIGNGGSAGIASHMAIDFSKNGGLRSLAFNDSSALTCLANDFGYESVFAKQIEFHARPGDLLVAISSSGKSPNIIRAVEAARRQRCAVVTFSGFGEDNELRTAGDVNFYIRSREYGFVEIGHLAICHAMLDLDLGWIAADE
jgi:D-sedoheptulose 7-phosphate isomerase